MFWIYGYRTPALCGFGDAVTGGTQPEQPQDLNSGQLFTIAARPQSPYQRLVRAILDHTTQTY